MIRKICASNFKAIGEKCIGVGRGLNLVVGPPASGKSSMMESLAFLMQSKGEDWLITEGNFLVIHDLLDVINGMDASKIMGMGIEVDVDDFMKSFLEPSGVTAGAIEYEYKYRHSDGWVSQTVKIDGEEIAFEKDGDGGIMTRPRPLRLCTPPAYVMHEDALMPCENSSEVGRAQAALFALRQSLRDRFFFLGENRVAWWKRTFETTVDLPTHSVGGDGQYTIHFLSMILTKPEYSEGAQAVKSMLFRLGVDDVTAGFVEPNRVSGYISMRGRWGPLYHAGLAIRSLLPLLVQLVISPRGSTVVVDGIDIGLNEEWLESVIDILLEASKDLQIIATSRHATKRSGVNLVTL